jgi:CheY-like chemotaxis protein
MPDDHSKSVPPLPIPNRTVKRLCADDSAATSVKVGYRQASYKRKTPAEMLGFFAQHEYDVIVLDVMLPGLNGLELCQKLRNELNISTPVLMLTARDTLQDKVAGFNSGADDYLVKPFSLVELEVRLKALVRRAGGQGTNANVLRIGELSFNTDTWEVSRAGQPVHLTKTGYTILRCLMREYPAPSRAIASNMKCGAINVPTAMRCAPISTRCARRSTSRSRLPCCAPSPVSASVLPVPMRPSDSLRRRIVVAYLHLRRLRVAVLCLYYAWLRSKGSNRTWSTIGCRKWPMGFAAPCRASAGGMPAGLSFHHGDAIPVSLRGLPHGVHDITSMASAARAGRRGCRRRLRGGRSRKRL